MVQELRGATMDNENGANVALVVGSCMENISAHGIPNIKRTQSPIRRLLWMCAFLASFSMCVWQVKLLIDAFLNRQVTTNVDIKSVTNLTFPAVTICNLNNMRLSYLKKQDELYKELLKTEATQSTQFQEWNDANLDTRGGFFDMIDKVTEFVAAIPYDDRAITGHNISDALLSCSFNGYPCLPSNFTYTYNYMYGNCYTFNKGTPASIQYTTNAGPLYAVLSGCKSSIWFSIRLGVYLLNGTLPILETTFRMGMKMSYGFGFRRGLYDVPRLCLETQPPDGSIHAIRWRCSQFMLCLMKHVIHQGHVYYNMTACMKDCMHMEIFNNCGCYDPRYVFLPETTPICSREEAGQVRCMENVKNRITIGNISCRCGPACKEILFETSISSSMWPGTDYMDTVVEKLKDTPLFAVNNTLDTEDYIKKNFVKLNIYYENLQYDYIEQVPTYTFLSLISNVGGHLGLWIGMSALTLLEFLECFYDIVKHICAALIRRRKAKQINKKNTVNVHPSSNDFQNDAFSQDN
ncbi:acid-sensing ion channel 1C-like [Anneissia japonica]|uniref:acid-sensing ion channel 1C-like n=1 Tax=Anneissia japonica TaxID=1529436 RepID=UPI0014256249|nr:acid-sensing ion channel 1C-like [Anneissia japonica]